MKKSLECLHGNPIKTLLYSINDEEVRSLLTILLEDLVETIQIEIDLFLPPDEEDSFENNLSNIYGANIVFGDVIFKWKKAVCYQLAELGISITDLPNQLNDVAFAQYTQCHQEKKNDLTSSQYKEVFDYMTQQTKMQLIKTGIHPKIAEARLNASNLPQVDSDEIHIKNIKQSWLQLAKILSVPEDKIFRGLFNLAIKGNSDITESLQS